MNALTLTSYIPGYELLDSGNGEKLEKVGPYRLRRPEPRALWNKTLRDEDWERTDAHYIRDGEKGKWISTITKSEWELPWNNLRFIVKPTSFKHIGIFPEQQPLWSWIQEKIETEKNRPKVLNLFAYTGAASVASLSAGAEVTHVDASHESVTWAHENVKKSGLEGRPIRWIVDDVMKYVKREAKRGMKYDGIIMDPPKFGRGTSGQVWKMEEDFPKLLEACNEILVATPLFFVVTAYALDYSSIMLQNLLRQYISKKGNIEHGELTLEQSSNKFLLPTSIFARWSRD